MQEYIGCDAHKKYSVFVRITEAGEVKAPVHVKHEKEAYRNFLCTLPQGSKIAVETVGNWYWMIDAMEQAGHKPQLTHAVKAKLMMGQVNKTDPLDAKGLAVLLRNGTLPSVFIPSPELRDERELPRMRMALVKIRTHMKNRVHATLSKYAIVIDEVSDMFGVKGRELLTQRLSELPPYTRQSVEVQLKVLDSVAAQIGECEKQMEHRHVGRLYQRLKVRKGHAKAVVAVARHLAEAAFWVLKKQEPYKEPKGNLSVSLTQT